MFKFLKRFSAILAMLFICSNYTRICDFDWYNVYVIERVHMHVREMLFDSQVSFLQTPCNASCDGCTNSCIPDAETVLLVQWCSYLILGSCKTWTWQGTQISKHSIWKNNYNQSKNIESWNRTYRIFKFSRLS